MAQHPNEFKRQLREPPSPITLSLGEVLGSAVECRALFPFIGIRSWTARCKVVKTTFYISRYIYVCVCCIECVCMGMVTFCARILIRADRGIGKHHLMDGVQGQTSPCGALILPLIASDLLPPDWHLKHTLT